MIKISINPFFVGKMPADATGGAWFDFNTSFQNRTIEMLAIMREISRGHAIAPWHRTLRKAVNFVCGQHIGVDFDDGSISMPELLAHPFVRANAGIVHQTSSHTAQHPRLRALFFLPEPIFDIDAYTNAILGVMSVFEKSADRACKDPVRLFYGARDAGCEYLGNYLTEIPEPPKVKEPAVFIQPAKITLDDPRVQNLIQTCLTNILLAPDGQKHTALRDASFTIGGLVGAGYLPADAAGQMLWDAVSQRNIQSDTLAKRTIVSGIAMGSQKPLYFEEEFPGL